MKKRDKDYLNCNKKLMQEFIPNFNDKYLKLYCYYLIERNNIYKNKEIYKTEFPWTEDKILQENSFICIKRYLDRTSRWLIDNITNNDNLSYEDKIWRSIVFRIYNKIETAELINLKEIDFWNNIEYAYEKLRNLKTDPFTRAYKVIRLKYAYMYDYDPIEHNWRPSALWYINRLKNKYYKDNKLLIPEELEKNANSSFEWLLKSIDGVGNFLAYQIWCDLCYINEYPMSTNYFVSIGNGCRDGIQILTDNNIGDLSYEEFLFWMRDNIDNILSNYDNSYNVNEFFNYLDEKDRYWDLQDIENSFCEFSKYVYLLDGKHKRPRKYIYKGNN